MRCTFFGRAEAVRLQVVALEDVERFDDRDAPGAGRRHANQLVAAIVALDDLALLRLILLQVVTGDEAVVGLHLLLDQRGGLAFVEPARPLIGDPLQGTRQVGLLEISPA